MSEKSHQLHPIKFGIALGSIWGLGWLLLGWTAWLWQYGIPIVNDVSSAYWGYAPTFDGAIYGAVWGFIDFFVFGWLVAKVYNCGFFRKAAVEVE